MIKEKPKQSWKQWTLIILSAIGFLIYFIDLYPDRSTEIYSQMALRLAIVLATLWLAFPQLEQLFKNGSLAVVMLGLLGAFVVAKHPAILLSIVILCFLLFVIQFAIRIFFEK